MIRYGAAEYNIIYNWVNYSSKQCIDNLFLASGGVSIAALFLAGYIPGDFDWSFFNGCSFGKKGYPTSNKSKLKMLFQVLLMLYQVCYYYLL